MRNVILAALAMFVVACSSGPTAADGQATYEVDPMWPQPLGNSWILGSVTGVAVDSQDHIWLVHRGAASLTGRTEAALTADPPGAEYCCMAAPAVLEFDQAGAVVNSWGGPGDGYVWPQTPGGMDIDADGNVWIAAAGSPPATSAPRAGGGRGGRGGGRGGGGRGGGGRGGGAAPEPPPADAHVLKFSGDGTFLMQLGTPGDTGSPDSTTALNRPADVAVDSGAGEVYVADSGNRRVVVFDAATGDYKRHWGAFGEAPDAADPGPYDPSAESARQFLQVNCVEVGDDGLVYVCDRNANRIQIFEKDGTFVQEVVVSTSTMLNGAVWDVAFADAGTLLVANGQEQHVLMVSTESLAVVPDRIGGGGRWPGGFYGVGSLAVDSQGNLYTGETLEGKRVQKFVRRQQ